jgi:moderate conductance mechanosensitive channel
MKENILKWSEQIIPWLITHGLQILLILIGTFILQKVSSAFITKAIRLAVIPDETKSKESEKKREETLIYIFRTTIRIIIIVIATLMILQQLGIEIGPILAGAGIVGLAVGFGGQYLIRDIISGLFIILENQYRIGDVIKVDDTSGLVEEITLRKTTLRDIDGIVHHIPHGEIKKVSNLSKEFARVNLNVGIGYSSNLEHVIEVINKVGNELAAEPDWKDAIIKAPQFLRVDELADSAIVIKILGDTIPHKQWDVSGEMRKRILIAFNKERIEIPFPQRVIHQAKE